MATVVSSRTCNPASSARTRRPTTRPSPGAAGSTTSTSTDGRISTWAPGTCSGLPALPSACNRTSCSSTTAPANTFLDVSSATGAADTGDTKGVAFADYDMDGDIDMFVVDQGGSTHLFQNITPRGSNHWLEVRAAGTTSDRDGCGATVEVEGRGPIMQRTVPCGSGSTGSANQPIAHFGLGSTRPETVKVSVRWPTGRTQTLDDVAVDQLITVEEPPA